MHRGRSDTAANANANSSGKKKEPKPKLFGPGILRWGGGLPREGVGAEKLGMSLETRETKLFWWDILGFCRDIPEVPEKFEKKKFVFNFRSLVLTRPENSLANLGHQLSLKRKAANQALRINSLPCPSFPCFFGKRQGKPPKKQGFFIPTEPLKSLEKKGKTVKKTRKSSQGEKTRNSKKTRKGRTR